MNSKLTLSQKSRMTARNLSRRGVAEITEPLSFTDHIAIAAKNAAKPESKSKSPPKFVWSNNEMVEEFIRLNQTVPSIVEKKKSRHRKSLAESVGGIEFATPEQAEKHARVCNKIRAATNPNNKINIVGDVDIFSSSPHDLFGAKTHTYITSPKEKLRALHAKVTSGLTKNEEAIRDLCTRIPEIENIFDICKRIGNGTFSTVLLATLKKEQGIPEDEKRKFAIKHHVPTSNSDRIMKELKCMAKIGGTDNVVGVNCCIRYNKSIAFVMPYLAHDRFHEYYNRMDLNEIRFYLESLLIALRRVHSFNLIHRDVKPSNFLYNRTKRQCLLVDFGLAQKVPSAVLKMISKTIKEEKSKEEGQKKKKSENNEGKANDKSGKKSSFRRAQRRRQFTLNGELKVTGTKGPKMNPGERHKAGMDTKDNANSKGQGSKSDNPKVCDVCSVKKEVCASRAGTPGYRPPEVLLKYPYQTTAVDIWAVGVIFLSLLSSVYPFFKAPNDYVALAEMVTIFGDKIIRKTATALDRLITLNQRTKPLDLRKVCVRFRNRNVYSSPQLIKKYMQPDGTCKVCTNCDQFFYNCLCVDSKHKAEPIEEHDPFPDSAYDLLYKLLEINPHKRITADEALKHPFFNSK